MGGAGIKNQRGLALMALIQKRHQQLLTIRPQLAQIHLILPLTEVTERLHAAYQGLPIRLLDAKSAREHLDALNQQTVAGVYQEQAEVSLFQELSHWPLLLAMALLLWQFLGQPRPQVQGTAGVFCLGVLLSHAGGGATQAQAGAWQHPERQAWQALEAGEAERVLQLTQQPHLLGAAWFQLGDYPQAALAFEQALAELTPRQADSNQALDLAFNAGTAWLYAGDAERALEFLNQVLATDSKRLDACINRELAQALKVNRGWPEAEALQARCQGAQQSPSTQQDASSSGMNDWLPGPARSCPGCLPLSAEDEQLLEQLEDDPWRLLRHRFRQDLREANP